MYLFHAPTPPLPPPPSPFILPCFFFIASFPTFAGFLSDPPPPPGNPSRKSDDSDCSDCKNWLWKSIIAIFDFESQLLGFGQSEQSESSFFGPKKSNIALWKSIIAKTHFEQSEPLRGQKPTSSNPSHPSNPSRPQICALTKFQTGRTYCPGANLYNHNCQDFGACNDCYLVIYSPEHKSCPQRATSGNQTFVNCSKQELILQNPPHPPGSSCDAPGGGWIF